MYTRMLLYRLLVCRYLCFCASVLFDLPAYKEKIQILRNKATRLIFNVIGTHTHTHTSLKLHALSWISVKLFYIMFYLLFIQ